MKMPRRRTFGTKPKPFSPLAPKAPSVKPTNLPVQTRPRAIPAVPPTTPGQKATPAVPPTPMKRTEPNRLQPNPVQQVRPAPVTPQGLDKLHTIVNRETGETMQVTQQAWKDMAKGSDATYRRGGPANKVPANKGRKP